MPRTAFFLAVIFGLTTLSAWAVELPRPAGVDAPPQVAPAEVAPAEVAPAEVAPAEVAPAQIAPAKPFHLEEVFLKSGRSYRGLIESVGPEAIKFVQIIRPGTAEMSIAPRRIWRNVIARTEPLSDDDHERLVELVRDFRASDHFGLGQLKRIALNPVRRAGWPVKRYRGEFFLLDSSADDATTRHSIVQMEQIFGAYQLMLPPREKPKSKLEIVLWGSPAQYHALLARRGSDMANPAFYSPEENTVMAGLELPRFARQLNNLRSFRDEVQQRAEEDRLAIRQASKKLKQQGVPQDELQDINRTRRERVDQQAGQMLHNLALADQQASADLQQASQRTFAMLYHEAFHAYLENYVYPHDRYDVPRWLNEGLAQIFENGRLEGDSLRFDGPAPRLLEQLRADLRSGHPLALDDLLKADHQGFLVMRPGDEETSHRSYLYSWGVAQYLTQELHLLGTKALDEYVSKPAALHPPRARFERLVGEPLDKFEAHWRQAMLGDDAAVEFGIRPAGIERVELPRPQP